MVHGGKQVAVLLFLAQPGSWRPAQEAALLCLNLLSPEMGWVMCLQMSWLLVLLKDRDQWK